MSHYPSTAELAAFRRSFALEWWAARAAIWHPSAVYLADERRHGIGYQDGHPMLTFPHWSDARREAGAMRTRAYEASRCPVCSYANLPDSEGCVCYTGDPWLSCDICDGWRPCTVADRGRCLLTPCTVRESICTP